MTRVLFVCLGNICRSPAAEGIFKHLVNQAGLDAKFEIDSAGTGDWHVGEKADARMRESAKNRGYNLTSLARQITKGDLSKFDLILTMDNSNFRNVQNLDPSGKYRDKIQKMTSYCKIHSIEEVPDPYTGPQDGFDRVIDILEDACTELLGKLKTMS